MMAKRVGSRGGMNRRTFLRRMAVGAAALSGGTLLARAAETTRRPNILVILTDDQAWADIHSHGNDTIVTPVLDRLASQGAEFDRFYTSPVCAPTRAELLTGRYHLRTGVTGVTHGEETMRSEETTLAEILREAGYATGCFGKWHNGAHYPNHPNGQGFDEFFGFCAGHWNNYFNTTLERNGEPVKTEGYINDVVTDAALAFIDAHQAQPFFCYVPYNTPHSPFQVPDQYFDPYKEQGLDNSLACVYGMCKSIDDNVGRLIDRLESLGLTDDTIVVFFGDNGPHTERYNGGMLGRKGSVHEGGVRNSLFIRWPGHIPAGTVVKPIAAAIDLLPTLTELANVPIAPPISSGAPAQDLPTAATSERAQGSTGVPACKEPPETRATSTAPASHQKTSATRCSFEGFIATKRGDLIGGRVFLPASSNLHSCEVHSKNRTAQESRSSSDLATPKPGAIGAAGWKTRPPTGRALLSGDEAREGGSRGMFSVTNTYVPTRRQAAFPNASAGTTQGSTGVPACKEPPETRATSTAPASHQKTPAAQSPSVHRVHTVHKVHTKLAASASSAPARDLDGVSLVPLLIGNAKDWPDRMLFSHWKGRGAVRTEQYRLVVERDRYSLYDMIADPGQKTDIAEQDTATAARLQKAYDTWYEQMMRETGDPPPTPIGHPEMPVVTLPAPECTLHGNVKFKGDKGWANDWITNWTSTDDSVTWDIDIVRPGTYALSLLYTCPAEDVGAELAIEVGDQRLTVTITKPHNPNPIPSPDRVERKEVYEKEWAELPIGQLQLPTGRATVTVRATKIPGKTALDLKAVQVEWMS